MYRCQMPECDYVCEDKSQINNHHIIPIECDGEDVESNRIMLCPNCHYRVFVPESKNGIHSRKHSNSVILEGKLLSTAGHVVAYRNINEEETQYHLLT